MSSYVRRSALATALLAALLGGAFLLAGCGDDDGDDTANSTPGAPLTIGETFRSDSGSIAVLSFDPDVTSEGTTQPQEGNVFASAEVEACVASSQGGTITFRQEDLTVELDDGASRAPTGLAIVEPALVSRPISAGDCASGFVTYEVPEDATAQAVVFQAIAGAETQELLVGPATVRWNIE